MSQNKRLTKEEMQEDKFINLVLQSYAFLQNNLRTIIITLAIAVIGVVAYLTYTQNQENKYVQASANFNKATETYKEAETNFFDVPSPTETEDDTTEDDTTEESSEEKTSFQDAEAELQSVFDKYANTKFADKARFNYAKSLYFQGKYSEARAQFEKVIETSKPENQIYTLYAHKAIGNCYEQEGDYAQAITTYDAKAFPDTPQLAPEIRQYVLLNAKYNQALCHEKLNAAEDAKATYKEIIDEFKTTVNHGIEQRSIELIKDAKEVILLVEAPIDVTKAEHSETEELYFEALMEYTDAIRTYKVKKDIEGGLSSEIRKRIRSYEDVVTEMISNVLFARKSEESGFQSTTLNSYNNVVGFEKIGLNRELYELAVLNYDRLATSGTEESNE